VRAPGRASGRDSSQQYHPTESTASTPAPD